MQFMPSWREQWINAEMHDRLNGAERAELIEGTKIEGTKIKQRQRESAPKSAVDSAMS